MFASSPGFEVNRAERTNSSSDRDAAAAAAAYQGVGGDADEEEVRDLARTLTVNSFEDNASGTGLCKFLTNMSEVPGVHPISKAATTKLDPNSDDFDAKFWVKNMKKMFDSDPGYYRPFKLGVAYRDLRAYGVANDTDYQPTVANALWKLATEAFRMLRQEKESEMFNILKDMDGIMRPGEVTVVLGRPGSGCSTLLKTIACNTYGFHIGKESQITYDGLTQKDIEKHYRGDVIYSAESDIHFPQLSVGDTLEFAARLRTPHNRGTGVAREEYAKHMASVYMATYGLMHTRNTKVGGDFVRGVSGGERKRVSIAEVSLSGANIQCWDNATRGLDAATALEFVRALKTSATVLEKTPLIAIYQCSQDAYDLFDNAVVLYEGYQIFFGRADKAKEYFIRMGYECPDRQTTADFLTSITNPMERVARPGYENKVPKVAEEFDKYWKSSPEYAELCQEIDRHFTACEQLDTKKSFRDSHAAAQAKSLKPSSPFRVSFMMQVKYIIHRNFLRMEGDPSISLFMIFGQLVMGLILSSVLYNMSQTTKSFYHRGAAIFFGVLFNAFSSLLEIMALFEARPIVEKHRKYALYRPAADALAGIISDLPVKFFMSMSFNLVFYFMVNLRRDTGRFFFFWLICGWSTLVMSHLFRSIGAVSTSLAGAMTPAIVLLMAMIIYTGFVIPTRMMLGWARWINYINPIAYAFESLMLNEFQGRSFECAGFVPSGPGYEGISNADRVCTAQGSRPGDIMVNGSDYLKSLYNYTNGHKWRNFGIVIGFTVFFLVTYICLTELNKGAMQKGEIVLFLKGSLKKRKRAREAKIDSEFGGMPNEKVGYEAEAEAERFEEGKESTSNDDSEIPSNREIFFWKDLTYQVKIKSEHRVILDHVDGWVKPGQITALMGASGAGKTTLLNCLSERVTSGEITDGVRMVNGHELDSSFQRSIGYVQQQDLHLAESTVREALQFSAYLRQSNSVSKKEKDEYVDYIIDLLEMTDYADALVGVAGEGLNVEQRKRLTIGVELVAKPKLLLFLDEPTSGLDSQTAWSICKMMRKLADHGQAILCTIHQPSAVLMQEFDRLLFMRKGGQTVYFGDLGKGCSTMIKYFESQGADLCPADANPAEWMLHVVGAAPGSRAKADYYQAWKNSNEYQAMQNELSRMETELSKLPRDTDPEANKTYAAPLWKQYLIVTERVLVQDWRSPGYIYSKLFLTAGAYIFNGFSFFKAHNSVQGLQNQMYSIFMSYLPLTTLIDQMLPSYIKHRDVYETREAPSRTFSWVAFILAQITSEIPFQIFMGTVAYFCWYYPVGLYRNAEPTDQVDSRGVLMWLLMTALFVFISTFGQLCVSFQEEEINAANLATLLFTLCLTFCGVLATRAAMPGFWVFMYYVNPFTYLVQGMLATGLANAAVVCEREELVTVVPPEGQSCSSYLEIFIQNNGGYSTVVNGECRYCQLSSTNGFLRGIDAEFSQRWRNWGIVVAFIGGNIILTGALYWLFRVPKGTRQKNKCVLR
ncbi:uncharacterized protein LODBEIA_P18590 [Lodderomyces beijingensis]|uniref:ABC transporter domain-containing protein n=1 Tax=Lodderomyces beijingensis TaxID=1775926 RepID=A0ABP0ZMX7_9ASCO